MRRLRQPGVFRPGFVDHRDLGLGVLPQRQETVVKSDLGQMSLSFEQIGSGVTRVSGCCVATGTFKFDGKEYPADYGNAVTWSQVDALTWQMVSRLRQNSPTHSVRLTVSGDEKTLTVAAPNDTIVLSRVSGRSRRSSRPIVPEPHEGHLTQVGRRASTDSTTPTTSDLWVMSHEK